MERLRHREEASLSRGITWLPPAEGASPVCRSYMESLQPYLFCVFNYGAGF